MLLCCYFVAMSGCPHCKLNDIKSFLCRYVAIVNYSLFPTGNRMRFRLKTQTFSSVLVCSSRWKWSKTLIILIKNAYIWKRNPVVFQFRQRNGGKRWHHSDRVRMCMCWHHQLLRAFLCGLRKRCQNGRADGKRFRAKANHRKHIGTFFSGLPFGIVLFSFFAHRTSREGRLQEVCLQPAFKSHISELFQQSYLHLMGSRPP